MATLQERLSHAKNVAEWKIDQQARIIQTQKKIDDLIKQAARLMESLALDAYALHQDNKIQKELLPVCEEIDSAHHLRENAERELAQIRAENPPELVESELPASGGLVCPVCGQALAGRFCPEHGVEGVAQQPPAAPAQTPSSPELICPKCGKKLTANFCSDCGLAGVPPGVQEIPKEGHPAVKKRAAAKEKAGSAKKPADKKQKS